jgi:hypothetical protein
VPKKTKKTYDPRSLRQGDNLKGSDAESIGSPLEQMVHEPGTGSASGCFKKATQIPKAGHPIYQFLLSVSVFADNVSVYARRC